MDNHAMTEHTLRLSTAFGLTTKETTTILLQREGTVPLSVFASTILSPLEALVKHLHENKELRFSAIANIIGRDQRNIAKTYHEAKKKEPELLITQPTKHYFPLKLLQNRTLSVFEHLVAHLQNQGLTLSEIASLTKRDQRTIWTIANRAKKKQTTPQNRNTEVRFVKHGVDERIPQLSIEEITAILREHQDAVPVSIFANHILTPLEALVKHLQENKMLRFSTIGVLTGRDQRNIATTYFEAAQKEPAIIRETTSDHYFPLKLLQDRSLSVFEHLVTHLQRQNLSFSEIAELTKRDQRTIWTIANRAEMKKK
jgi:hypothetical protein